MTTAANRRGALLLGVLVVVWAAAAAAGTPAPAPTKCRLPVELLPAAADFPPPPADDRGYDVLRYDLDLRIDPARTWIEGRADIVLRVLAAGRDRLRLDLVDELPCAEVRRGGLPVPFSHLGDSLVVRLDPLPAAAAIETLTVTWSGHPPRHGQMLAGLLFRAHDAGTYSDTSDDQPIVFNVSEPWSAHAWWPCKDHPADKALLDLTLTVPDPLVGISNGVLLADEPAEAGWRRTVWREDHPIATYLVSVALSNYESWSESCLAGGDLVSLEYHVFPQDRTKAEFDFAVTCPMLEFITELCGPYPFAPEKYAQVEVEWVGAMENQTATSVSAFLISGDGRFETLIIHELAHSWFGNSLTPGVWADIWLNEGFARYAEALWLEHAYGSDTYDDYMLETGPRRHPELFAGDGLLSDPAPILPNSLVYDKGAWVLHLLRGLIGDAAFFAFLADYTAAPELVRGTTSTAAMIAIASAAAGRDLGGFFAPLLDTDVVPQVTATVRPLPAEGDLGRVELTLVQRQDPVFELPVPVHLHFRGGMRRETVNLLGRSGSFEFTLPQAVDSVLVDPEHLSFLRSSATPPPQLTVTGPAPNPVSAAGADFALVLLANQHLEVQVYDARGRRLDRRDLGLLGATALPGDPDPQPLLWRWDGRTADGRPLPAGVYWLEFRGDGGRSVRKALLIH